MVNAEVYKRAKDTPPSRTRPRSLFWHELQSTSLSPKVRICFNEFQRAVDNFFLLNGYTHDSHSPVLVSRSGREREGQRLKPYPQYDAWQVFATTREGTQLISSPSIESKVEEIDGEERFYLRVHATNDASSRYGTEVLPGVGKVDFYSDGRILGAGLYDPRPTELLTDEQVEELTLVFTRVQDALVDPIMHARKAQEMKKALKRQNSDTGDR